MWRYNPFTGNFDKVGLVNVAPLCEITTSNWTGSQFGEVLFTGDGTTKDFSGKVDLPPVNPLNSFTLHYTIGGTTYTATADENGNITGTHITSGTINQDGTYEIHFDTPPDNGTDGTADYDYGIPPSNLENALDPSNPNPSGWGWKTTTGSTFLGKIKIIPPTRGRYMLGIVEGHKGDNTAGSISFKCYTSSGGEWIIGDMIGNVGVFTFEIKRFSFFVNFYYDSDIISSLVIKPYVTTSNTYYVRFYEINVFKIG